MGIDIAKDIGRWTDPGESPCQDDPETRCMPRFAQEYDQMAAKRSLPAPLCFGSGASAASKKLEVTSF